MSFHQNNPDLSLVWCTSSSRLKSNQSFPIKSETFNHSSSRPKSAEDALLCSSRAWRNAEPPAHFVSSTN